MIFELSSCKKTAPGSVYYFQLDFLVGACKIYILCGACGVMKQLLATLACVVESYRASVRGYDDVSSRGHILRPLLWPPDVYNINQHLNDLNRCLND